MNSSGLFYQENKRTLSIEEGPGIGVIGGSGLCTIPGLAVSKTVEIETPYGRTSDVISIGELAGVRIAFLPRHGREHTIPPHKVPYKANLVALRSLGVKHVIATCVAGSLQKEIEPGIFVVPDQFINLTWGRDDTFETDRQLIHLPMARPYCEHIRSIIARELEVMKITYRATGTVVVIQGPRFSTIAESKMYALWGGDIVNMTQYPECYFARELGLCYGIIATVTDYDVGVPSNISMQPESMETILTIFRRNTEKTVGLLKRLTDMVSEITTCKCADNVVAEYYKLAKIECS